MGPQDSDLIFHANRVPGHSAKQAAKGANWRETAHYDFSPLRRNPIEPGTRLLPGPRSHPHVAPPYHQGNHPAERLGYSSCTSRCGEFRESQPARLAFSEPPSMRFARPKFVNHQDDGCGKGCTYMGHVGSEFLARVVLRSHFLAPPRHIRRDSAPDFNDDQNLPDRVRQIDQSADASPRPRH